MINKKNAYANLVTVLDLWELKNLTRRICYKSQNFMIKCCQLKIKRRTELLEFTNIDIKTINLYLVNYSKYLWNSCQVYLSTILKESPKTEKQKLL